jgi:P-type Ca2+ transporter type 2C
MKRGRDSSSVNKNRIKAGLAGIKHGTKSSASAINLKNSGESKNAKGEVILGGIRNDFKNSNTTPNSTGNLVHTGITQHHATELLKKYGPNELKTVRNSSPIKILLHQIRTNYVIYLLLASFIIALIVGKVATAYTILGVMIIVITVGFIQEYKAEKAIDALKGMLTPTATVIRDSKEHTIPTTELVPEDIIVLRSGDKVPADCILIDEKELRVNESVLTGESKELHKKLLGNIDIKNATNDNMIFMGTFITNGKCVAKILHTGMNTKFGSIANMISTAEKELPLQNKINRIIKYMVIIGVFLSLISGLIMLLSEAQPGTKIWIEALIIVLTLSIASFPEGFPVVLITTLAYGAYRMAQKNAIINRMSIIETLGETTVICSDKTGTITTGEMTVKKILVDNTILDVSGAGYSGEGEILSGGRKISLNDSKNATINKLIKAAVICNDSRIEHTGEGKDYKIFGSPTEASLLIMSAKAGVYREDIKHTTGC